MDVRTEIEGVINTLVEAIRTRDLDGVMSVFAPDVVSFDLGPPLRHGGGEAFRRRWLALFEAYQGPIAYDVRDAVIVVDGDVAFSHSLNRVAGTDPHGAFAERWLRWTACFRKTGGTWLIVHEHVSVPADLRSGQAVLDLVP